MTEIPSKRHILDKSFLFAKHKQVLSKNWTIN